MRPSNFSSTQARSVVSLSSLLKRARRLTLCVPTAAGKTCSDACVSRRSSEYMKKILSLEALLHLSIYPVRPLR
jgi:hypothetical protein